MGGFSYVMFYKKEGIEKVNYDSGPIDSMRFIHWFIIAV